MNTSKKERPKMSNTNNINNSQKYTNNQLVIPFYYQHDSMH